MRLPALDNLVVAKQLKVEPSNDAELGRMLAMARSRLADAHQANVSLEGRFTSAYNAAHVAALAMLRWHGYRSENRYVVFQCLEHTLQWAPSRWRIFSNAHQKRNLAEYEGYLEIEESGLDALRDMAALLKMRLSRLPVDPNPHKHTPGIRVTVSYFTGRPKNG